MQTESRFSPRKLSEAVEAGRKRLHPFRAAQLMFLRAFAGPYYSAERGKTGEHPLNLTFTAIRTLVPNLVFQNPKHQVRSRFIAYQDYAEMLSLALEQQDKQLRISEVYRRWIVDAIFQLGILKTGLCSSASIEAYDPDSTPDPGTVYTTNVAFDDFVIDPYCRAIDESAFVGDRVRVSRESLLASGLYNNDRVKNLPAADLRAPGDDSVRQLSTAPLIVSMPEDVVEVYELWVPRAKAVVTLPAFPGASVDDFLRVNEAYGPDDGPYSYLSFTPPIPNNPIPVSLVSIWYDLAASANDMARKMMSQAQRQKSVLAYRPSSADDAQEVIDAGDGDVIRVDDPEGLKAISFGGQESVNVEAMNLIQSWHNLIAGNVEGMAGVQMRAKTATEANYLAGAASTGLEDMRQQVYTAAAQEARKRAWYLHTDPLIEVPLIRRMSTQAYTQPGFNGSLDVVPARQQDIQVLLTPEARAGDFLDFAFTLEPESMSRVDSNAKLQKAMALATQVIPAAAQATQVCAMLGVPFSFSRFVTKMAMLAGMDDIESVFADPEYAAKMAMIQARGPQEGPSKGSLGGAMAQNGQPGQVMGAPSPLPNSSADMMQGAQAGANEGQAQLPLRFAGGAA